MPYDPCASLTGSVQPDQTGTSGSLEAQEKPNHMSKVTKLALVFEPRTTVPFETVLEPCGERGPAQTNVLIRRARRLSEGKGDKKQSWN